MRIMTVDNKPLEMFIVVVYNLTLLAGASYLIYYENASVWLYFLALLFAASWKEKDE